MNMYMYDAIAEDVKKEIRRHYNLKVRFNSGEEIFSSTMILLAEEDFMNAFTLYEHLCMHQACVAEEMPLDLVEQNRATAKSGTGRICSWYDIAGLSVWYVTDLDSKFTYVGTKEEIVRKIFEGIL